MTTVVNDDHFEPQKKRKGGTKKGVSARIAAINAMRASSAADNTIQAWKLRTEGRTVAEIAEVLGVGVSTAQGYLQKGLEAARETYTASAMDHIQVILGQLDGIISKWRALADCPAAEGADRAAAIVLKALEQRSKLLGLEGKGAGLVIKEPSGGAGVIDLTEALKSKATREALWTMLDSAEKFEGLSDPNQL